MCVCMYMYMYIFAYLHITPLVAIYECIAQKKHHTTSNTTILKLQFSKVKTKAQNKKQKPIHSNAYTSCPGVGIDTVISVYV